MPRVPFLNFGRPLIHIRGPALPQIHDSCIDKPTPDNYTCKEQKAFDKCVLAVYGAPAPQLG